MTRREIARLAGKAAHRKGTAHQWTSAEARLAGLKGGRTTADRKKAARLKKAVA